MSLLDKVLLQVSAPIQYAASWTADAASGVIEDYVYLVDVKSENERTIEIGPAGVQHPEFSLIIAM